MHKSELIDQLNDTLKLLIAYDGDGKVKGDTHRAALQQLIIQTGETINEIAKAVSVTPPVISSWDRKLIGGIQPVNL